MTHRDATAGGWTGGDYYHGHEWEEKRRRAAERKYGIEPERCVICGGRLDETTIHGVCPWCGRVYGEADTGDSGTVRRATEDPCGR